MDKASRRERRDYFLAYTEDQKRVERDLKRMAELTRKLMQEINWGVRDDKRQQDDEQKSLGRNLSFGFVHRLND